VEELAAQQIKGKAAVNIFSLNTRSWKKSNWELSNGDCTIMQFCILQEEKIHHS